MKMKLQLLNKILYRVPQFPLNADLEHCWDDLKKSIATSSPKFYEVISELDYKELNDQPEKVRLTIQKYFNRAKYRCTPYGTFAAVGLADIIEAGGVILNKESRIHRFADWTEISKVNTAPDSDQVKVFANSSYYIIGDSIRYIYRNEEGFELSDVPFDDRILDLLQACSFPISINDIVSKLGWKKADVTSAIDVLSGLQLVLTERHPNIIGNDYFKRLDYQGNFGSPEYIITEREVSRGGIDSSLFDAFDDLVPILMEMAPNPEMPETLRSFTKKFRERYDRQLVPVLEALDPESGLGYGDLETPIGDHWLTELQRGIHDKKNEQDNAKGVFGTFITDVINKSERILWLDNIKPSTDTQGLFLSNSLSAIVSPCDNLLILEQMGGATANVLLGRFTMAGNDFHQVCKRIAGIEQVANPGVLFFDIAYSSGGYVDNINRRQRIYDHQVSILNYDTSADPLLLSDIYLTIENNDLVLVSKKHGKRLVPRLSSAFNYTRSDLSLFRLLCDLQWQSMIPSLNVDIERHFPGLSFYPRVQYKNWVLSPAKWKLNLNEIKGDLNKYLSTIGASEKFKVGQGDQTLCLSRNEPADLELLQYMLSKEKTVWIQEAFIPSDSVIKDSQGNSYACELILSFTHNKEIYPSTSYNFDAGTVRTFPPGSEWLYLEIFCHPLNQDEVLTSAIPHILSHFHNEIMSWFFIRYNEGGHHIRLRFRLARPSDSGVILEAAYKALNNLLSCGKVRDIQVKTYVRELERYCAAGIERVEEHFCADSAFVIALLCKEASDDEKYRHCLDLLERIRSSDIFEAATFRNIVEATCRGFQQEHKVSGKELKLINERFRKYSRRSYGLEAINLPERDKFVASFIGTLNAVSGSKQEQLFSDLFHMHVNRLFQDLQRSHEFVLYEFMLLHLKKEKYGKLSMLPLSP